VVEWFDDLAVGMRFKSQEKVVTREDIKLRNYFFAVGAQGTMQVLTIVIMARFVTGL
jgi:hypothetical protein